MMTVADRVRDLEKRVASLERGAVPKPTPVMRRKVTPAPPASGVEIESVKAQPRPVAEPSPPVAFVEQAPAAPRRSLEVDFGRWMSRLGGASLVVAAGFLFAYAAKRGWLNPSLRVVAGLMGGAALVAAGEWQQRNMKSFAAALTGAGIGVLYVSVYAGYAFLDFFSPSVALALGSLVTCGGVWLALRHDSEAIAGLASVGGFLAPAIVLDLHAQPGAVLGFVLVLNGGLCLLRSRKGWLSSEVVAWIGTPLVAASPMSQIELGYAVVFLLVNVALFGIRPRLKPTTYSGAYTLVLSAVTATASFLLFEAHQTPGWGWFAGGMAVVLTTSARLNAPRTGRNSFADVATADLLAAVGFAVLAILYGLSGWQETVAWSALAAVLLLAPLPRLKEQCRAVGMAVTLLAVVHVLVYDARIVEHRLLAFLAAAAAVAAIRRRSAYWVAVLLASAGFAAQIAAARGADPWLTLVFLTTESELPTTRMLVGGTMAALVGIYAYYRKSRPALLGAAAYVGVLAAGEVLFIVERNGVMPLGLAAAAALILLPKRMRSIWTVAGALALAVAADLVPPVDYVPFLNRRAFAIGAVLGVGAFLLRGRPEGRASVLMLMLLGVVEVASVADHAGGYTPWRHLFLDLRTHAAISPFWNARFLFLAGAAATAFLAARRWPVFAVFGHGYVLVALGAEVVGIIRPELRHTVWPIFFNPGRYMAPQLALTGVVLLYGACLVTVGILEKSTLSRRIGLALLVCGGLKVSLIDLTALGELYRVGSFLVLGTTYLAGSYAYSRWVT